ncbi:MAG: methyltransferase domain-containing protein [Pirellulales bacterium]|nr:methyltransferase domain-containing protein [Pirellulales bacterium]
MNDPSLPPADLLQEQAEWLAPARSRLLRRAHVARCCRVLDLGCGRGAVTAELVRRGAGPVVALDRNLAALGQLAGSRILALPVQADAARLPFASGSFDLVFCQFTLMWVDAPAAVSEIHRVLAADGQLIAMEPDYAGMIEYPAEIITRSLWLSGLKRAGADGSIGRKLPGILAAAGFGAVRVDLLDRLVEPSPARFELLAGLPLEPAEQEARAMAQAADARLAAAKASSTCGSHVVHLPVFLVVAGKRPCGIDNSGA